MFLLLTARDSLSPAGRGWGEGARMYEKISSIRTPSPSLPPDQVGGRSTSPLRGEVKRSRSRDAPSHPSFAKPRVRKPFQSPPAKKEGGGAPRGASTGIRSAAERQSLPAYAARTNAPLPQRAGSKRRRARLSAPHRGHAPRVLPLNSARAALPGITGCKREDPLRRQCSEHLAVRSCAGRDDAQSRPQAQCMAALPGTAPVPLSKVPSRKAPS